MRGPVPPLFSELRILKGLGEDFAELRLLKDLDEGTFERLNVGMFEGLKVEGKNAGGGTSAPQLRWSFDPNASTSKVGERQRWRIGRRGGTERKAVALRSTGQTSPSRLRVNHRTPYARMGSNYQGAW